MMDNNNNDNNGSTTIKHCKGEEGKDGIGLVDSPPPHACLFSLLLSKGM
jgi:hypothetical protein